MSIELRMRNLARRRRLVQCRADQEVDALSFPQSVNTALRAICFERAAIRRGASAMLVGLAMASGGMVAFAEPAKQAATATATPGVSCVPRPQGVVVTIDTPNPGAVISPDSNVLVTGVAYDTASTSGPGVDRVTVFLGDRDAGGIFWGEAMLGLPSPQLGGNLTTAGFSRRSPSVPSGTGGRDIFVYARSSTTGREVAASVPVFIGAAPTSVPGQVPTAVVTPPVCTAVPTVPPTAAPTETPVPVVTPPTAVATATVALPAAPVTLPPTAAAVTPSPPATSSAAMPPGTPAPAAAATTQTTAPRGGGVPVALGLLVVAAGAGIVGSGVALRRRERRRASRQ